jgi:hypothetical protein
MCAYTFVNGTVNLRVCLLVGIVPAVAEPGSEQRCSEVEATEIAVECAWQDRPLSWR